MEDQANAEKLGATNTMKKCDFCGAPESETRKHKQCSACKQRFYCCADCQKFDWQRGHKAECKKLREAQAGKK